VQLEGFLEQSALTTPSKTALVVGERRLTYAQVEELANCLAHGLLDHGLKRGDRVAVFMENSIEAVLSIFAILKAGAVFTIINPAFQSAKVAHILNHSGAVVVISSAACCRVLQRALQSTSHPMTVWSTGKPDEYPDSRKIIRLDQFLAQKADGSGPPRNLCVDIDTAALIYTSGSTGVPKAVAMTHLNLVSAISSIAAYLENTADDIILSVLPLSSSYGLGQILIAFKLGATIILERSFAYPRIVLERIVYEHVTGFPVVPTIAAILLQLDLSIYKLSDLRYITSASAVLPRIHIAKLRRLLPAVRLYSMYGLTECNRVSYLPPNQIDLRPDSVGRGMPNQEVYIVDDSGARVGPGIVGELVVRGSSVMGGYWNDTHETEKSLKVGSAPWERILHTGDLFRADEDGFLYFVARKDNIIKTKGEKVSPKEIEDILYDLEGVAEAVVLGIPDPIIGAAIKAVVTLRAGSYLTKQEIKRHCGRHLDGLRVPAYIEIRETLPKNEAGKTDCKELICIA